MSPSCHLYEHPLCLAAFISVSGPTTSTQLNSNCSIRTHNNHCAPWYTLSRAHAGASHMQQCNETLTSPTYHKSQPTQLDLHLCLHWMKWYCQTVNSKPKKIINIYHRTWTYLKYWFYKFQLQYWINPGFKFNLQSSHKRHKWLLQHVISCR